MSRRIVIVVLLATPLWAFTTAMFRGRIVRTAEEAKIPGQIFVMGRNGSLRKVQVSHARVLYADDLPAKFRKDNPAESLVDGAEIRVEAEGDGSGTWRATTIQILQVPGSPKPKEYSAPAPHKHRGPEPTLSRRSSGLGRNEKRTMRNENGRRRCCRPVQFLTFPFSRARLPARWWIRS